jgi:polyphosphate glucokinase
MPHLELAHHPISGKKTYDEYLGNAARRRKGRKAWNSRVARVIDILRVVVRFDHLYLGGGNAKDVGIPLPEDVTIVANTDGLTGGIGLWRSDPPRHTAVGTSPSDDSPDASGGDAAAAPEPPSNTAA